MKDNQKKKSNEETKIGLMINARQYFKQEMRLE